MSTNSLLPPHGNYRELLSYQKSEVIYDLTYRFCARFLKKGDRTIDQMVQAARSGKQNIVEGSKASLTSTEMEIKLTNVARASLEELLEDYRDYLRVRDLPLWPKDSREAQFIRNLGHKSHVTYTTYRTYVETRPAEIVANIAICLIHQANYLLDQQLKALEKAFLENGGLRERMTRASAGTGAQRINPRPPRAHDPRPPAGPRRTAKQTTKNQGINNVSRRPQMAVKSPTIAGTQR